MKTAQAYLTMVEGGKSDHRKIGREMDSTRKKRKARCSTKRATLSGRRWSNIFAAAFGNGEVKTAIAGPALGNSQAIRTVSRKYVCRADEVPATDDDAEASGDADLWLWPMNCRRMCKFSNRH